MVFVYFQEVNIARKPQISCLRICKSQLMAKLPKAQTPIIDQSYVCVINCSDKTWNCNFASFKRDITVQPTDRLANRRT